MWQREFAEGLKALETGGYPGVGLKERLKVLALLALETEEEGYKLRNV